MNKGSLKTLVFGASTKPHRYAYRAVKILSLHGHEVIPLGLRSGQIDGIEILTGRPDIKEIHTITMYVNADRQKDAYDYLLGLKPKRIIFNPGAENHELSKLAREQGIFCENACTLVMLSVGNYVMTSEDSKKIG